MHLRFLVILILLTYSTNHLKAQQQSNEFQLLYQTYLTGHPLITTNGFSINYSIPIVNNEILSLGLMPEFTFLNEKNIKNHFLLSPLFIGEVKIIKKMTAGVFIGPSFIYANKLYDSYSHQNGNLILQSSKSFYLRPQLGIQLKISGFNIHRVKISPALRINALKWNSPYDTNLFEGYKAGLSFGTIITLKK